MDAVVKSVKFEVLATTRDECFAKLDELGMQFLDDLGGAPWVMPDDDVKKVHAAQAGVPILADDQGMCYYGLRSYFYGGPVKAGIGQSFHDGFKPQRGASGEDQV
jgi:hypothetical protein